MVIAPDGSWSVPSLSSVRTAPDSVAKIRTPWQLLMSCWSSERPPPKRASIVPHECRLTGNGLCQVVVVDQPRFAYARGDHREGSRFLKRDRVDELHVLRLDERLERQPGRDPGPQPDRLALARGICLRRRAPRGADA